MVLGVVGQNVMGDIGGYFYSVFFEQGGCGVIQCFIIVVYVIKQDVVMVFDIIDDVYYFGYVCFGVVFVDNGDFGIEQFGQGVGLNYVVDIW